MAISRSENMSRIRSRGNKSTELRLIEFFRQEKITGWRRNHATHGKPDFVFPKRRITLFVDGCFWHNCPIHGHTPKSNVEYWSKKIARNVERDRTVDAKLAELGWTVVRIWEHELRKKNRSALIERLAFLHGTVAAPKKRGSPKAP